MTPTAAEAAHAALAPWESYYVITGSAAAALTGLEFVVQTLIAQADVPEVQGGAAERTTSAFGSPTVVHFVAALLLCVGIHNAWDTVAYLTARARPTPDRQDQEQPPASPGSAPERG